MRVIQVFPLFVAMTALLLLAVSVFAEEAREGQQTENAVVELQRLLHTKLLVDVEKHVLATANELGSTYVEPQWTPKTWESYNFWKRYQPRSWTLGEVKKTRIDASQPMHTVVVEFKDGRVVTNAPCPFCGVITGWVPCCPWNNQVCVYQTIGTPLVGNEMCVTHTFYSINPLQGSSWGQFPENGAILVWNGEDSEKQACAYNVENSPDGTTRTCAIDWINNKFMVNPSPTVPLSTYLANSEVNPNDKGSVLRNREILRAGEYIRSPNYRYQAIMQPDSNFVIYDQFQKTPLWSSTTVGFGYNVLYVQDNQDIGLYGSTTRNPASVTGKYVSSAGEIPVQLIMQDDGNLVLYKALPGQNAVPVWAWWWVRNGPYFFLGNLK